MRNTASRICVLCIFIQNSFVDRFDDESYLVEYESKRRHVVAILMKKNFNDFRLLLETRFFAHKWKIFTMKKVFCFHCSSKGAPEKIVLFFMNLKWEIKICAWALTFVMTASQYKNFSLKIRSPSLMCADNNQWSELVNLFLWVIFQ